MFLQTFMVSETFFGGSYLSGLKTVRGEGDQKNLNLEVRRVGLFCHQMFFREEIILSEMNTRQVGFICFSIGH